jgi:REP element-mobilizing transposase RayT
MVKTWEDFVAMAIRYNPETHHRRSIRLRGYDYSQAGAYFVTLCQVTKECIFGDIDNGVMWLNEHGEIVVDCWDEIPQHFPGVQLDAFMVMPNHAHGVLVLPGGQDAGLARARHASPLQGTTSPILGTVIGAFKSAATRRINLLRGTPGEPVWLRNYFERVIRDEDELNKIREYITYNPSNWAQDKINPANGL